MTHDLFGGLMAAHPNTDSLPAAIAEIRRELAMRRRVYPRWIQGGKMSAAEAEKHFGRMLSAHDWLMALLARAPVEHPHALEQDKGKVVRSLTGGGDGENPHN